MAKPRHDNVANKIAPSRIPKFGSVDEAAEFWDMHSVAEFLDEIEEVRDVRFVKAPPRKEIRIRLEQDSFEALRQEAQAKGIAPATLVRRLVQDHLQAREPNSQAS